MEAKSLRSLIEMAIKNEEAANFFYEDLAKRVKDKSAQETLEFLAGQERGHRDFLAAYLKGEKSLNALGLGEPIDYHIAQYADKPDIQKDMNSSEIYLVAAHREWNSHNFYKGLASVQPDGEAKEMLLKMANEELKHKEKVEYLYSNTAFPQTAGG